MNIMIWCVFDSATKKVLVSDTKLNLFIPPQVCKMNIRLRQICGCKICIIPKYMQIVLNRFITNIASFLQQGSNWRNKHTTRIKCFQMVDVYMLLSNTQLSTFRVLLINQIIIFIWSLILVFVLNSPSILLLMKIYMMHKNLHWFISLFVPIKEDV